MGKKRVDVWAPFAIAAFPLLPLLEISRVYHADWVNHCWVMDYYGHYLAAHGWFPRVLNTQQIAGLALPLFYGHLMYAIGGILTLVLGGDLGIRALIALLLLWQCFAVRNTVQAVGGSPIAANTVAALACWTIYPLTNLYNRGALTEFFAMAALTCSVCYLLKLTLNTERSIDWSSAAALAFSYSLAAIHPITALYGGVFLACVGLAGFAFSNRRRGLLTVAACCLSAWAVILAPQLYMLARWGSSLSIALSSASTQLRYLPSDFALSRLAPFPFDISSLRSGANLQTAYLDSQLNCPLLVIAIVGMVSLIGSRPSHSARKALAAVWFGWIALVSTFLLSTFPALAAPFGTIVNRFQFAYRLVSYQDLALLVIAICLVFAHREKAIAPKQWMRHLCVAAIAIALAATVEKWTHASVSPRPSPMDHSRQNTLALPYTFYAQDDYTTTQPEAATTLTRVPIKFHVAEGKQFGDVDKVTITVPGPALLTTNISAFALNRIRMDGIELPWQSMQRSGVTFAFAVPAGAHTLESRFEPGAAWQILRAASEGVFFVLAVFCLALSLGSFRSGVQEQSG